MTAHSDGPEFLTTREVAELLRIKERKLYDLVSAQEIPCIKATGKLLFPRLELLHWIRTGERPNMPAAQTASRPKVVAGSHDPLLEWAIRESGCGLAMQFDGSLGGLDDFENGRAVVTGLHVPNADASAWNTHAVQNRFAGNNVVLVKWAVRQQGLLVARGNPHRVSGVADLLRCRVAIRQAGAGGMKLFEYLLQREGLQLEQLVVAETCRTENEAIAAVAGGLADASPGLQSLAIQFGLDFVPTLQEQFDLLVCRKAWFEEPIQTLLQFTRTESFRNQASRFEGYDTTALGTVVWNA